MRGQRALCQQRGLSLLVGRSCSLLGQDRVLPSPVAHPAWCHPLEGAASAPSCWREMEARVRTADSQGSPCPQLSWCLAGVLEALRQPDVTSVPSSLLPRNGWRGCPILQAQLGSSLVARGYESWALAVSMTTTGCSGLIWPLSLERKGAGSAAQLYCSTPGCRSLP